VIVTMKLLCSLLGEHNDFSSKNSDTPKAVARSGDRS
jgi:hypothetical protein